MDQTEIETKNCCPLCGGLNHCAVELGKPIEDCWCSVQTVPAELLMKLPAELRNKRCVCQACIMAYNQADN